MCVCSFDEEEEAIAIANATPFGLAGMWRGERGREGGRGGQREGGREREGGEGRAEGGWERGGSEGGRGGQREGEREVCVAM